MLDIEFKESLDEKLGDFIGIEFNKFADKNNVICNYTPFNFVALDDKEVVGIITGHSYYKEVKISDLIVLEQYRCKNIGRRLIKAVENFFQDKGFENINLSTYSFQAPKFYLKCGFQIEFIRESKNNNKLNKYFFIKYFGT